MKSGFDKDNRELPKDGCSLVGAFAPVSIPAIESRPPRRMIDLSAAG